MNKCAECFHRNVCDGELVYGWHQCPEFVQAADIAIIKHGKWKLHKNGDGTCDQCRFTQLHIWDFDNYQKYCGVCGAKMSV